MQEWFQQFMTAGNGLSLLTYVALFLLAFLESTVVIGLFVPGTMVMLFVGFLTIGKPIYLLPMIGAVTAGTMLAYAWAFALGRKHGREWLSKKFHLLGKEEFEVTHRFFEKYGIVSVLIGRFIGPMRPFMAFVAGMGEMNEKKFHAVNGGTAALWATTLLVTGFLLGDRYAHIGRIGLKITLAVIVIGVLLMLPQIYKTVMHHWKHHSHPPDVA